MGVGHDEAMGTVWLSVGHDTTAQDILQAVRSLARAY